MSGLGYDTSKLTLTAVLPDGSALVITGVNDGVNGFEWSATRDGLAQGVLVEHEVLIDGITPAPPAELADAWDRFQAGGAGAVTSKEYDKLADWREEVGI